MAGNAIVRKSQLRAIGLRGMLRVPDATLLPPEIAYLMQNMRTRKNVASRRPGAVRLGGAGASATGAVLFDGTTAQYGSWPDHSAYDLGIKFAIHMRARTTGTPPGTQYLLSRDVSPVSAGKHTLGVIINSSRQLGWDADLSDGSAADLAPAAASVVAADTWFSLLIVRDGASLALYIDGNPTPALTAATSATLTQIAGAQAIMLAQNYDGTAVRSGAFDGRVGAVTMFRDFEDVPSLLKYTTAQEYPAPRDPRVILHSPFCYSAESGTAIKDWSSLANHGTLTGAPTRVADSIEQTRRVQYADVFAHPTTGKLVNVALIGGDWYLNNVRVNT